MRSKVHQMALNETFEETLLISILDTYVAESTGR